MSVTYSIKELEKLSGIKAHTIRIWEQRYGILKAARTSTNIRYYSEDELKYLLSLALLNRNGKKISHLAKMTREEVSTAVDMMAEVDNDYKLQIEALVEATIDFNDTRFEKILNTTILQIGFEETIKKLIIPFLEKLGVMWVSGNMMAAQEHFITQLIRQKILVGIDGHTGKWGPESKKFILFLPNGEWHELTLLFLHYLLKVRNQKVTYLGPSVPLKDVIAVGERIKPDYFYTIITNVTNGYTVDEYLNALSDKFPDCTIYGSGAQFINTHHMLNKNVVVLNGMENVLTKVNELRA